MSGNAHLLPPTDFTKHSHRHSTLQVHCEKVTTTNYAATSKYVRVSYLVLRDTAELRFTHQRPGKKLWSISKLMSSGDPYVSYSGEGKKSCRVVTGDRK